MKKVILRLNMRLDKSCSLTFGQVGVLLVRNLWGIIRKWWRLIRLRAIGRMLGLLG